MALAHVTTLVATAAARVLTQYQPRPKFTALLAGIAQQAQTAEDAFWGMIAMLSVDTATGIWLDYLGKVINQPRGGLLDDAYRNMIKARIIANSSNGRIDDVINAAVTAIGFLPGNGEVLTEWNYAAVTLTIPDGEQDLGGQAGDTLLISMLGVLRGAKSAGVKLTLLFQDDADSEIFVTGDATGALTPTGKGFDDAASPGNINAGRLSGALDA